MARDEACIPRFELYTKDEGGYAGVALAFMKAKITGTKGEMILCVPNHGTVDWLEDSDIIEVSCNISKNGATPKKGLYELPECAKQLIRTVKCYERLAAEAIVERNTEKAIDALMINPLVLSVVLFPVNRTEVLFPINLKKKRLGWTVKKFMNFIRIVKLLFFLLNRKSFVNL